MRTLLIASAALALSACVGGPKGDIATYDTLKAARQACLDKGEDLVLKPAGNDERMSAYECKGK